MKKKLLLLLLVLGVTVVLACNSKEGYIHKIDTLNLAIDKLGDKDPGKVLVLAKEALQLAETHNYAKGKAEALGQIGYAYYRLKKPKKAEDYYNKALSISEFLDNKKLYITHLKRLAIIWYGRSEYSKALALNNKALALAIAEKDIDQLSDIYNNSGLIHTSQGDLSSALKYLNLSLTMSKKIGNKAKEGNQYENIGIIYKRWGWYQKALEYYFKSLKINEDLQDKERIAVSYNNIAIIYSEFNQNDLSLKYYNKSIALKKELNNRKGIGITYNNIGTIYENQKKYDKALEYYHKALQLKLEFADKKSTAHTLGNIGSSYSSKREYDKGLYYYKESLRMREEVGDKFGQCITLMNIGEVYKEQKNYSMAIYFYTRSLAIAQQNNYKKYIKENNLYFAEAYAAMGNYTLAYQYYKQYNDIKNQMFTNETGKKINEIKIRYETEKKENEIKLLKKEKLLANVVRNLLILALVLFVSLVFVVYKLYRLKKMAHAELEVKHGSVTLDRSTIVKATETISSEIIMSALLEKLIKLLVEYSGAGRGVLLLEENNSLFIEAEMKQKEGLVNVLQTVPLEEAAGQLPLKIVRLVHINHEGIVLGNAEADELFITDNYVKQHAVKSIFCVPIIRQAKLVGILYLENRDKQHAFTSERIEIFNVLATQIAISIENARFYDKLDHKVKERTREVEKLNDLKNRFLAIVAHDLKNPLKDLMLRLEMLIVDANDTEAIDNTKNMKTTAEYMYRLLDELLDIAIIESGKIDLNFTRNHYAEFINEKIAAKQPLAKKKQILLQCEMAKEVPPLHFDRQKINQVLDNLLSNAMKYTGAGKRITVIVDKEDKQVITKVKDEGPGIPEKEQDTIFTEFARSSVTLPDGEKSTGLGLAIVKKIINAHMGNVGVKSVPGEGATFYYTLPIYYDE